MEYNISTLKCSFHFSFMFVDIVAYNKCYLTMDTSLTSNAIALLMDGSMDIQPALQIVSISLLFSSKSTSSRYCVTLSDGTHKHETILPPSHKDLVAVGEL